MIVQIQSFLAAHQVAIGGVIVAVLDLLIELHPGIEHNNIVSLILGFFKKAPPSA